MSSGAPDWLHDNSETNHKRENYTAELSTGKSNIADFVNSRSFFMLGWLALRNNEPASLHSRRSEFPVEWNRPDASFLSLCHGKRAS